MESMASGPVGMVSTRVNHESFAYVAVTISIPLVMSYSKTICLSSIDAATIAVLSLHARRKLRP